LAQERKKTRIVLASILKPVDDTRMFEKMANTFANEGFDVHIIGYPSAATPTISGIMLHSLKPFRRLSVQRILAKWKVFLMAMKLQPDIFIFTTHELLAPAIWMKVLLPVKVIYDVRENYYRNILYSGSFSSVLRLPLAILVRWKEKLLAPAVDHFLLAERNYETELRFYRASWTVIENKNVADSPRERTRAPGKIRLLFSGTLAESTGVFKAISLTKELFRLDPSISLTIVGYAAQKHVCERILNEVKSHYFIRLVGGAELVPHKEVIQAIQEADFGIIAYPPSRHTMNSLPTKLFEYLGAALPIIVDQRWPWIKTYEALNPFVIVDFDNIDYAKLLAELKAGRKFEAPPDVTWDTEAVKLIDAVKGALKH
jgi:glycosyltransferase involved in cell wall biosynthesis